MCFFIFVCGIVGSARLTILFQEGGVEDPIINIFMYPYT